MQAELQTLSKAVTPANQCRLPHDALDLLEQFGSMVSVHRGHDIYGQGDPAESCWQVVTGCIRTVMVLEDGRRQVSEFLWPGDFVGMDDPDIHDFSAEAVTDATLRRYPRRMVDALAQSHAALSTRLRAMTVAKLRRAHVQMMLLGRKSATERLASFLLDMHRRSTSGNCRFLNLPMSRTDMADYLGLTIETICRTLLLLRRCGIIQVSHDGIELRDCAALNRLVGSA
jgi:CRP-like cAMP-binding protein